MMMRVKEDAEDMAKRLGDEGEVAARLLDLQKAYPRVNTEQVGPMASSGMVWIERPLPPGIKRSP